MESLVTFLNNEHGEAFAKVFNMFGGTLLILLTIYQLFIFGLITKYSRRYRVDRYYFRKFRNGLLYITCISISHLILLFLYIQQSTEKVSPLLDISFTIVYLAPFILLARNTRYTFLKYYKK